MLVRFSPSPTLSIPELRAAFDSRVIAPGDAAYDQARTVFYRSFDRRPAAIVRPVDATEVAQVVALARETGMELRSAVAGTAWPGTASPRAASCSTCRPCGRSTSTPSGAPRGPRPA
jgi:hypothetical protein